MVSSRVAVAAVVAAARSVLSLHTAGQSRDDTIANLKEKLGDISDVIDGMNENIRVLKLPGDVAAGRNKCTLKSALKGEYGDHESLTLFLEDVNGPELIRQTSYTHQHMGKLFTGKIGYTAGLKKFEIAWYVWSRETLTTENLPAARQHFSEIMPFAHLGDDVIDEIYRLLPNSNYDIGNCEKIFAILADNPPPEYKKGAQWFEDFHLKVKDKGRTLIRNWRG